MSNKLIKVPAEYYCSGCFHLHSDCDEKQKKVCRTERIVYRPKESPNLPEISLPKNKWERE